MLYIERDRYYIVYPSWADLKYRWDELDQILSSPVRVGHLDPRLDWRRMGYPETIQPFKLMDGPCGGGIIAVHADPAEKCMVTALLAQEANIDIPPGAMPNVGDYRLNVYYLEPRDAPLHNILFAPRALCRKAKLYLCRTSAERIESACGSSYWVFGFRRGKGVIGGLDEVPAWARHFGVDVEPATSVPEAVATETARRFANEDFEPRWYLVREGGGGVSRHFAVVVYVGYHLRWLAGKRLSRAHYIASWEG